MIWWVLTYLDNWRPLHTLGVLAETNLQAHLFMKWTTTKPARRAIYKRVRGVNVWCGYEYIWDTPNLTEQSQPSNTFEHLFDTGPLLATDHVWYYLFSIGERPFKECQGPLIHVPPPEALMASARIYNSLNQLIPPNVPTPISYDSVLWDNAFFYDPAQPTRLTIALGALYEVGCCQHVSFPHDPGHRISIVLNTTDTILMHGHRSLWPDPPGSTSSLHTLMRFQPGDFLQVVVYHWAAGARNVAALPDYSPHFWVNLVGPYPA